MIPLGEDPGPDIPTIEIPADQPPSDYPAPSPGPYYPGFDLPDETPAPNAPSPPRGPPELPRVSRPPMGQPSTPKPRPEPQVPAPKYLQSQTNALFGIDAPDHPPFGVPSTSAPPLPAYLQAEILAAMATDTPGPVYVPPPAVETFGVLPLSPAPADFNLVELPPETPGLGLFDLPSVPLYGPVPTAPAVAPASEGLLASLDGVLGVGTTINRAISTVLSLGTNLLPTVGRIVNPILLLAQTTEAGFAPGVEEALVTANLARTGLPPGYQNIPPPQAGDLPDITGLSDADIQPVPVAPIQTVVVSAPRVAPVVLADPLVGLSDLVLGAPTLPALGETVAPTGARFPAPRPRETSPTLVKPAIPTGVPAPTLSPRGRPGQQPRLGPQPQQQPKPSLSQPPTDLAYATPGGAPTGGSKLCPKQPDKKKPQRKKQPRQICYRGTYTELRSGLIKHRKERIACR